MFAWHSFAERAGAGPGAYLGIPVLARSGISAIFTTRLGGLSGGSWSSLNLALASGDDPATVKANRARALEAIGMDGGGWTGGRQVHGTRVARVTARDRGAGSGSPDTTIEETDALWTAEPGIALAVLAADCVPVLLADPKRRRVAVVHAGWRGMVAGVIENAAACFEDAGDLIAAAGPSIGPCCYEVGGDVAGPAIARFGERVMRGGNLDLWAAAAACMREAGIVRTTVAALCTRCESHRFYSHRAGDAGRQGVLACIDP